MSPNHPNARVPATRSPMQQRSSPFICARNLQVIRLSRGEMASPLEVVAAILSGVAARTLGTSVILKVGGMDPCAHKECRTQVE